MIYRRGSIDNLVCLLSRLALLFCETEACTNRGILYIVYRASRSITLERKRRAKGRKEWQGVLDHCVFRGDPLWTDRVQGENQVGR